MTTRDTLERLARDLRKVAKALKKIKATSVQEKIYQRGYSEGFSSAAKHVSSAAKEEKE